MLPLRNSKVRSLYTSSRAWCYPTINVFVTPQTEPEEASIAAKLEEFASVESDVFQTEEWFGNAGGAYPMIMSTERFAELVEGSMGAYVKNA